MRNKQPKLIKAIAFKNGSRQNSANIAARNLVEVIHSYILYLLLNTKLTRFN